MSASRRAAKFAQCLGKTSFALYYKAMGINGILGRRLWRLWVVLLVTALAVGIAFMVTRNTTETYQSTVDVTVPASQGLSAGTNGQYVQNFTVGLTTASLLGAVSALTHVSSADLGSGLAAAQQGNSSFISVTYTASTAEVANLVSAVAAQQTALLLAQPGIEIANGALASATAALAAGQGQVNAAQQALIAYSAKNGNQDPISLYQGDQSLLVQLNANKVQTVALAKSTASFDAAIAATQVSMVALGQQIIVYKGLTAAQTQAQATLAKAQDGLNAASADLLTAKQSPLISVATSSPITRSSVILKAVLIGGGLGFVLALALMLVSFALSRRRVDPPVEAGYALNGSMPRVLDDEQATARLAPISSAGV